MTKLKKLNVFSFLCALLLGFSIALPSVSAKAESSTVKFEETNVLDDLRSASNFNILKYPAYKSLNPEMYLMNVVEYCYSFDPAMQENYGLYLYVYNPNQMELSTAVGDNKVQMAVSYGTDGKPTAYEKFDLQYCSQSEEEYYEGIFYKYKVIDHVSSDGKSILTRVKSSERRYDISGIEMLEVGTFRPKDYGVGGTYKFTGYAKGFGAIPTENTLKCSVTELETIQLEVHKTHYRTGEYKKNYRHDLTSVYFSVPQRFFDAYGNLQKIKAEWYEYETTPIAVTSNSTVYNGLTEQLGKSVSENGSLTYSLYTDAKKMTSASGHYWDYGFCYNAPGQADERLDRLTYAFSTNGENISKYVLAGSRLENYIRSYDKSFVRGKIQIPGKTLSADLFESELASDRKAVAYVGNDVHHKLVTFDAGDSFDMLNYNDSTTTSQRFFKWLFGLAPSDIDQSYKGISPIHVVTDSERNNSDISKTLLIDGSDSALSEFTKFYDDEKAKGNKTVLFRFAQTDYRAFPVEVYNERKGDQISNEAKPDTFIVQESVFLNFDIIELTFSRDGVYTVIPVASDPIDIYNDITIPEVKDPYAWIKMILLIVLAVVLFILLYVSGLLPLVLKIIVWIITAPFKLVVWIFKKIFKKRQKYDDDVGRGR